MEVPYRDRVLAAITHQQFKFGHYPTSGSKDISGAMNYVRLARGQSFSGKPIETAATRPYSMLSQLSRHLVPAAVAGLDTAASE